MAKSTIFALALLSLFAVASSADLPVWSVVNGTNGNACILASFDAQLSVTYQNFTKNGSLPSTFNTVSLSLPVDQAIVGYGSGCAKNANKISIQWSEFNHSILFNFGVSDKTQTIPMLSVTVNLTDSKTFPGAVNPSLTMRNTSLLPKNLSIPVGNSYQCWNQWPVTDKNQAKNQAITITFSHLLLESNRTTNSTTFDEVGAFCAADAGTTPAPSSTTVTPVTTVPTEPTTANATSASTNATTEMTTASPTNATTEMPTTTNSTEMSTIPTEPVTTETPTASPTTPEPQHTWFVNGTNGNICVLVQFRIHLTVPYNATNGNKTDLTSASFDLPQSAMVDKEGSSCNAGVTKMTQRVKLTFTVGKAHNVTVQFDQDKNGDTLVDQIAFDYDLSDAKVFPNATYTDSPIQHSVADRTFANIPKGNFYVCSTGAPATLVNGNVNITALFTDVEAQAFRNSSTTDFDGNGSVCPWDPSTSSVAPSTPTTPTPNIKYASYNVTSGADICLYVQFGISAALKYKNTSGSVVSALISDANSGRVDKARSFCNNETAFIVIGSSWISNWSFGLNFTRKGDRYSLTQVELDFALQNYTNVIVNANDTSAHVSHTNVDQWSAAVGHSYKCIDTATWSLNTTGFSDNIPELQLMLHDIQVQPFMTANATNFHFGDAEECPQDYTSDIVPIAVGCALAALVVIVLIAYVIGRRRNRARGYESM